MRAAMEASQREEANKGPPPTKRSVLAGLKETCLDLEDVQNGNDVCTICLDEQHVGDLAIKLNCGHCFHKKCVWPWLEQHCTCPVCRLELNDGGAGASSREKAMRRAHHRNMETRRKSHAQTVAEQRQRMETMQREEREGRQRQESDGGGGGGGSGSGGGCEKEGARGEEGKGSSPEKKRRRYDGTSSSSPSSSNNHNHKAEAAGAASAAAASSEPVDDDSVSSNDDPAQVMASALLASGISIGSMRGLLNNLGLEDRAAGALEKRELAYAMALACSRDHLLTLNVSELRRRARGMRVDISTCFDKRGIVEVLHEAVVVMVEQGTRW
jgi:hypothetical protein